MKKNITNLSKLCSRFFALVAVLAISSFAAKAADVDFGEIVFGQEYNCPMFKTYEGYFTPTASGEVTIAGPSYCDVHKDSASGSIVSLTFVGYGPYTQKFTAEAGTTYYITGKEWDNVTMKITMAGAGEDPLALIACDPAENSYYDLATDMSASLQLMFNHEVQCASGWMLKYVDASGADAVQSYSGVSCSGKFLQVPVQSKLLALLRNGDMKIDSQFQVILDGLQTASGLKLTDHLNDAGYTVFTFKVADLPTSLLTSTVPSNFLSYWIPGDDASLFEATFDGPITKGPNTALYIQYGDVEIDNGYYQESVPFTIEGNTIKADLSGVLRTPATMLPVLGTKKSEISIRIQSLLDAKGNPVASPGSGTVGSYQWTIPYTVLDRANIACEFTPANGGSIRNKTKIELWLNGMNTLSFDGFDFECPGEQKVTVAKENAEYEAGDTPDEAIFNIPIPAAMQNKKGVRLSLSNLKAADGYDHTNDVKAVYDSFVITFANPANGAQMEYLTEGSTITINANCADANPNMCVIYDIEDLNPEDPEEAIIKSTSYMQRQEDGSYSSEVFGSYKMVLGHDYKVSFTAWATEDDKNYGEEALGTDYLIWSGLTPPYQYSPVQFVSIDPAPGTLITKDDRVYTVKFDGYVNLRPASTFINVGMGTTAAFESIEAVNPQTDDAGVSYSDEWVLTVPASYLESLTAPLDLSIKAYDQDGLLVKGTEGKEENTFFYFSYDMANRYVEVETYLPDHATEPIAVSEIWAAHEKAILPSYTMPANSAYVMTKSREIVAYVKDFIIPINDLPIEEVGDMLNTEVGMILDAEITTPGSYIFYAPANYFSIGTEFEPYCSAEIYWTFNVYKEQNGELPHAMDILPAPGNVDALSHIEIVFTDEDEINIGSGLVTLSKDDEKISTHDCDLDWDFYNKATLDLGTTHTDKGVYKLAFPAGYFVLGSMGDRSSEPFTLEYNLGTEGIESITITTASGKVYDLNGTLRNDANLPAGIYVIDGKKVMVK